MSTALALLLVLLIAGYGGARGLRDHRAIKAGRARLLDNGLGVLSKAEINTAEDGLPRLRGFWNAHPIDVRLIPDTMTIRRLPQLWLSVRVEKKLGIAASVGFLARHAGTEFYAQTPEMPDRLDPPAGLPWEVMVRGSGQSASEVLTAISPIVVEVLQDPRIKEITVTPNGVRIIRQAAEGRRGEHLLLRQVTFDNADIPAGDLKDLLNIAQRLIRALAPALEAAAE